MKKIITLVLMQMVMIAVLAATQPASVSAREMELTVGPGQEYEYETIQAAVNDARQHSRILVYSRIEEVPDRYEESVTITTNYLQIIAQGSDVKVIPPEGEPGFDVNADHVTVRGFDISGTLDASGIVFQGSHNTFAENTIHFPLSGMEGFPAIICDDYDGGSDYNTIENNKMSKWGGTDLPDDSEIDLHMSHGIVIKAWSDAVNKGNVIKNNQINEVHEAGIWVVNGTGFQISGNSIEKTNEGSGISITAENNAYQGHHRILENTIIGCAQSGILLYASNGTVLAHNHISDNEIRNIYGGCITLKADSGAALVYNHVISNYIGDGVEYGVNLYIPEGQDAAVNNNLIRDNVIYFTYVAGISLTTGADHNRILKNEVQTYHGFGVLIAGDNNLIVGNWIWNGLWARWDTGEGNRWLNNSDVAPWEK